MVLLFDSWKPFGHLQVLLSCDIWNPFGHLQWKLPGLLTQKWLQLLLTSGWHSFTSVKKKKEKESGNKYFTLTVLSLQLLLLLNTVTATIETPMAAAAFKFLVAFINIYERPIEILLQTRLCIFYL